MKDWEKIRKYLDLARKQRKWWNLKVTKIPTEAVALGTQPKGLKRFIEVGRIMRSVLDTWRDLLSLRPLWVTTSLHRCEKITTSVIIIIITIKRRRWRWRRSNHIKARIVKTQEKSKCRLCGNSQNDRSHFKRMQQISTEGV